MKKPLFVCGIFALLLLVGMGLFFLPFKSQRDVGKEHFKLLQPGMTQAEAGVLLHGPPRNNLRYPAIIWLPQATGKPISARIGPAFPALEFFVREDRPKNAPQPASASTLDFFPQEAAKDGHQAIWVTKAGLIAVYFGQDGKLRNKYISTVHESVTPSVMDWLASRPMMIRRSFGL
jgi:hypothetical protein